MLSLKHGIHEPFNRLKRNALLPCLTGRTSETPISIDFILMHSVFSFLTVFCTSFLALASGHVHAGRPLTVEDASVNEVGRGHVEIWWSQSSSAHGVWTAAPAWSPTEGVELAAAQTRSGYGESNSTSIQAKFRLTPSQAQGCNFGALLGLSRTGSDASQPYVNGLFSCHHPEWGSVHTNVGLIKLDAAGYNGTWGVAWERSLGPVVVHLESFGQQHAPAARAIGLRHDLLPHLQIDGSLGRHSGQKVRTLGLKWML